MTSLSRGCKNGEAQGFISDSNMFRRAFGLGMEAAGPGLIKRKAKAQVLCIQEGKQGQIWFVGENSSTEHAEESRIVFVARSFR